MTNDLWDSIANYFGRLYRDRENGWVLGVCAGLADYYHLNVTGVRVLAGVLLVCWTIPTIAAYLILGLVLRDRPLEYRGDRDERRFWSYEDVNGEDNRGSS